MRKVELLPTRDCEAGYALGLAHPVDMLLNVYMMKNIVHQIAPFKTTFSKKL